MATICISALSSGETDRRERLITLIQGLSKPDEKVMLLLYGDGVYNLVSGSKAAAEIAGTTADIYVIAGDVEDRGLTGKIIPQAQQIDYDRAVDLIMESDHTVTGV